mmetsp:Transcript_123945/g.264319  ORF Transcript_123945/g.264319 Transcript_123945/m.264319 type:complete len:217 (+) Transcript_123945:946-1596(+)
MHVRSLHNCILALLKVIFCDGREHPHCRLRGLTRWLYRLWRPIGLCQGGPHGILRRSLCILGFGGLLGAGSLCRSLPRCCDGLQRDRCLKRCGGLQGILLCDALRQGGLVGRRFLRCLLDLSGGRCLFRRRLGRLGDLGGSGGNGGGRSLALFRDGLAVLSHKGRDVVVAVRRQLLSVLPDKRWEVVRIRPGHSTLARVQWRRPGKTEGLQMGKKA